MRITATMLLLGIASCGGGSGGSDPPPPPPPSIIVQILDPPNAGVVGPGSVRTFIARVLGTDATALTWSIVEGAAGGSLNGSTYTAPNNTGVFHVVATLVADPRFSDTATVNVVPSGFRWVGSMNLPRSGHTASLLPDGQVLVAGGDACTSFSIWHGDGDPCPLQEAELFDPINGVFLATGNMMAQRVNHTATSLPNGQVLITGGGNASAELYEWSTGVFASTGNMSLNRSAHTATLLPDGKVLIAGGEPIGSNASAELYDPQSGTFSSTSGAGMSASRGFHTATRLSSGSVLIIGGFDSSGRAQSIAELYDPVTESFLATGSMIRGRALHTATLLENDTVLITGGFTGTLEDDRVSSNQFLSDTEIYDLASGTFRLGSNLLTRRYSHFTTLLPGGKVLVSGGDIFPFLFQGFRAEVFDPSTQSFLETGSMGFVTRLRPAVAVLGDGRVLVTGGSGEASAETYQ